MYVCTVGFCSVVWFEKLCVTVTHSIDSVLDVSWFIMHTHTNTLHTHTHIHTCSIHRGFRSLSPESQRLLTSEQPHCDHDYLIT